VAHRVKLAEQGVRIPSEPELQTLFRVRNERTV